MMFQALENKFWEVFQAQKQFWPSKSWKKNKQKSTTYVCYIGRYSVKPWNKRFVGLFQNLKAFSIFKWWPIPSESESFRPILEASRSPIFDPDLSFLKKNIFLSATTTFISLKTRKDWFSQGFAYKSGSSWQRNNFF